MCVVLTTAKVISSVNIVDFASAIKFIWWGVALVFLGCLFSSVYSRLSVAQYELVGKNCENSAVAHIFGAEENAKIKLSKQKIISILTINAQNVKNFAFKLTGFFGALAEFIFVAIILFTANFLLGTFVIGISALCLLLYAFLVFFEDRATNKLNVVKDQKTQALNDIIDGAPLAFDLNIEGDIAEKFSSVSNKIFKINRHATRLSNGRKLWLGFVWTALSAMVTIFMLNLLRRDYLTLTVFLFCLPYLNSMLEKTMACYLIMFEAKEASTSAERLALILSLFQKNLIRLGQNTSDNLKGNLVFNNVSFYSGSVAVFKHFDFCAPPRALTPIKFKTETEIETFCNLLRRTKMPTEGTITFDNINIYDFSKEVYPQNLVVVDSPFFFDGSIYDNLKVVGAGKRAIFSTLTFIGAKNEIAELSQGINTNIKSENLSPLLIEKLNIARALLTRSEVIVFKNIKEDLSPAQVAEIRALINKISKTHTVICVGLAQ